MDDCQRCPVLTQLNHDLIAEINQLKKSLRLAEETNKHQVPELRNMRINMQTLNRDLLEARRKNLWFEEQLDTKIDQVTA